MKRDNIDLNVTPPDLREAEALLIRHGQWAQDRYKKRRCASAEGMYVPPPTREDQLMPSLMPDFDAMKVERSIRLVPEQYRRVLKAVYIPQREHPMAAMRKFGIHRSLWELTRVQGIRMFWNIYKRHCAT